MVVYECMLVYYTNESIVDSALNIQNFNYLFYLMNDNLA